MVLRRSSLAFVLLGGMLASATAVLVATEEVPGVAVAAAPRGAVVAPADAVPIAGTAPGEVERLAGDAPSLPELQGPVSNTDEAPKLGELQQPTTNVLLTPKAKDHLRRTIGRLFVEFPDQSKDQGTATVVSSRSQDLVITAEHLLVNGKQQRATRVRFEPAVTQGVGQHGIWHGREWDVVPGTGVGMVLLHTRKGQHVQEAVGSQGICFDCPRNAFVHVYGYPKSTADGHELDLHCQVNAVFADDAGRPYGPCLEGPRVMGEGADGSAALTNLDATSGLGMVTAVHTRVFDSPAGNAVNQGAGFVGKAAKALYGRLGAKTTDPVVRTLWVRNAGGFVATTTITRPGGELIEGCEISLLAITGEHTRECGIPGGGSFEVRGEESSLAKEVVVLFQADVPAELCLRYSGTTFDFKLEREDCPAG